MDKICPVYYKTCDENLLRSIQSSVRLDKSNTMLFRFVQSSFFQICPVCASGDLSITGGYNRYDGSVSCESCVRAWRESMKGRMFGEENQ